MFRYFPECFFFFLLILSSNVIYIKPKAQDSVKCKYNEDKTTNKLILLYNNINQRICSDVRRVAVKQQADVGESFQRPLKNEGCALVRKQTLN